MSGSTGRGNGAARLQNRPTATMWARAAAACSRHRQTWLANASHKAQVAAERAWLAPFATPSTTSLPIRSHRSRSFRAKCCPVWAGTFRTSTHPDPTSVAKNCNSRSKSECLALAGTDKPSRTWAEKTWMTL